MNAECHSAEQSLLTECDSESIRLRLISAANLANFLKFLKDESFFLARVGTENWTESDYELDGDARRI
jgi:hypothetical protein